MYSYWNFADQKEITGYIHRVPPVKSSSKTAYFDCLFQTSVGQMRAVCFTPEVRQFQELSVKKFAMKLTLPDE